MYDATELAKTFHAADKARAKRNAAASLFVAAYDAVEAARAVEDEATRAREAAEQALAASVTAYSAAKAEACAAAEEEDKAMTVIKNADPRLRQMIDALLQ